MKNFVISIGIEFVFRDFAVLIEPIGVICG
jgi:hypothetical protein